MRVGLIVLGMLFAVVQLQAQETLQKTKTGPYVHFYVKWVNRQWKVREDYHVLKSDSAVKHGAYAAYTADGHLFSKGNFRNNSRVGTWEFYDYTTGTLIEKYDYDKRQTLFRAPQRELMQVKKGEGFVADSVDVPPHYPGDKSFFILVQARYPQRAVAKNASGAVFVNLLIDDKGALTVLDFIPSEELKKTGTAGYYKYEALQAIQQMSNYVPAMKGGKPQSVRVEMVPVTFKMPN